MSYSVLYAQLKPEEARKKAVTLLTGAVAGSSGIR